MTRHRWSKLRAHVYICRTCGTGRVNSRDETGWLATWHRPDGSSILGGPTPGCVVGPRTEAALAKYATVLALAEIGERAIRADRKANRRARKAVTA